MSTMSNPVVMRLSWSGDRSRTDDGQGLLLREDLARQCVDLVEGDAVDAADDLLDAGQLVVEQLGLGDAGHAGGAVLEAEDEAAAELALAALELVDGDALVDEETELLADDGQHVAELAGQAAGGDGEDAGVGVVGGVGVDGVRQAAVLADLLEQP